jgi:hypothetical protein
MSPPLESTKSQQKISKKQEEGDIEDDDFDLKLPSEWVAGNEDWGSEDDRTEAIFNGSIAQPPDKDEFGLDDSDTSDDSTPSSPSPQSPDVFADDDSFLSTPETIDINDFQDKKSKSLDLDQNQINDAPSSASPFKSSTVNDILPSPSPHPSPSREPQNDVDSPGKFILPDDLSPRDPLPSSESE